MAVATVEVRATMARGVDPLARIGAYLSLAHVGLWAFLFLRWATFGSVGWTAFEFELALAAWPSLAAYGIYGALAVVDLLVGLGLLRELPLARSLGIVRAVVVGVGVIGYYLLTHEFYGAAVMLGLSGLLLLLHVRTTPWALAYPAAYWLALFFLVPMLIVFVVSLGERARLGTVAYPALSEGIGAYFDDYARFFSRIGDNFLYLRIFWRSVWIAVLNTVISLLFGYPFAFWLARQPKRYRNTLIFLVMIPFWTNFLVRTYAWMLILRDSGVINNFWTITLHEQALRLAGDSGFFTWLAAISESKLPLLFNQPAVMLGLFYGYLPYMVLPLYSNMEKLDWSLLEAAADLGANHWKRLTRVLLPLTAPGIVAGSIIVFIPSLGAYVTPDLMGGAKVALLGNLLQQQFMTVRDWPFGSAIGFIMMAIMLFAVMLYFRIASGSEGALTGR
ncbi:MAG: ABC transporter permease [Anaerolineales bacterium]